MGQVAANSQRRRIAEIGRCIDSLYDEDVRFLRDLRERATRKGRTRIQHSSSLVEAPVGIKTGKRKESIVEEEKPASQETEKPQETPVGPVREGADDAGETAGNRLPPEPKRREEVPEEVPGAD